MDKKGMRVWELDFFRGIALVLMIIFHVVFDLREIYGLPVYYDRGIFFFVGKASVILFMIISGISSTFSRNNVKRGTRILAVAMAITVVTHLYDPAMGVKFGVLHYFGVCMLLYPVFKSLNKYWLIIIGTMIIIIGNIISGIIVKSYLLFPIGLMYMGFTSSDYYPLFPWMGLFLYGMALGRILYNERRSIFKFTIEDNPLSFIGRHTLVIYVVHQPLILFLSGLILK